MRHGNKYVSSLQLLLRKKAAEELKKEQERKAAERRRIIEERCGKPKLIDDANEGNAHDVSCPFIKVVISLHEYTISHSQTVTASIKPFLNISFRFTPNESPGEYHPITILIFLLQNKTPHSTLTLNI